MDIASTSTRSLRRTAARDNRFADFIRRWAVVLGVLGSSCTGGPGTPGPTATQLAFAVAPSATAINGTPLAPQPVIQLQDDAGAAVALAGRLVVAVMTPAGATLSGTTEVRTDAQGRAAFTDLTITGPVGERTLRFESLGLRTATAPAIQLTAGAATVLEVAGGNLQTATAGTAVSVAPTVQVSDASGNPIAGASVTFAVTGGGGTVQDGAATTGANGRAAPTQWVLGNEIGLNTLTATSPAVPGASAVFTATGVLGPPAALTIVTGDGQTATVGGAVATALSVKLTDALGHPLPNVSVAFAVTTGGGTLTLPNPLTNAAGIATLGGWNLGLPPGANSVTASRAGVPSVVFTATGQDFGLSAIAAGGQHSCGLDPTGAAFCWGANASGQLGNTTILDTNAPFPVSGGMVFTSITTGFFHSCGLVAGSAWCWGANNLGQLGDGTLIPRSAPVPVAGGFTFIALDAGDQFTCGIQPGGLALCWGRNAQGQVGDGTLINRLVPTPVSNGHVFSALDAGSVHACGLEGTALWCWGSNGNGRLGDGTIINRPIPTQVTGSLSFAAVTAGDSFTCALTGAGAGYCWGNGQLGFLGTGNTDGQLVPTAISGTNVFNTISTSGGHTCALTGAGAAFCWGANVSGEIGDGTNTTRLVPTAVTGGLIWTAISSGIDHTCGIGGAGSSYCWGRNLTGALGDRTLINRNKPVGVSRP